jgi:hypothetical protein
MHPQRAGVPGISKVNMMEAAAKHDWRAYLEPVGNFRIERANMIEPIV